MNRLAWLPLALLLGCGAAPSPDTRPTTYSLTNPPPLEDVAMAGTFDVAHDGAIVWFYAPDPRPYALAVYADPGPLKDAADGPAVYTATLQPDAAAGSTTQHTITGLTPGARYFYRLTGPDGAPGAWHTFQTRPPDDADVAADFLVAADFQSQPRYASHAFLTMASTAARFMVSLGDWPYSDSPWPGAETVPEYRERHRWVRLRPDVREFLQRMPVFAIYDDHEVANDWDQAFREAEPARFAAAMKVWQEFFPVRTEGAPPRRYRKWRWGRHVEIFLLDCRLYRAPAHAADDATKSMLGAEQKKWLFEGLRASDATFKIVFTSVPLAHGTTDEHWNAFTTERDEIEAALTTPPIPGLVIVTADQHWFAAHRYPNGIREYQFGPTQANLRPAPPPTPDVVARVEALNFGELRVDPGPPATLTVTARSELGALIYQETLTAPTRSKANEAAMGSNPTGAIGVGD